MNYEPLIESKLCAWNGLDKVVLSFQTNRDGDSSKEELRKEHRRSVFVLDAWVSVVVQVRYVDRVQHDDDRREHRGHDHEHLLPDHLLLVQWSQGTFSSPESALYIRSAMSDY